VSLPNSLVELETKLRDLSHDESAYELVRQFAGNLGKTSQRQIVFGKEGALLRTPILHSDAVARGIVPQEAEPFFMLQGDIVGTDTAYFMGERILGQTFVVASSTCDLMPSRREYACLFKVVPIEASDPKAKEILGQLLKFESTKRMYLPKLSGDCAEVLCNVVEFDGVVQIKSTDLLMATRLGSLSLIGWRIFGSLVRNVMVRAGEDETQLRTKLA
jgi:hypothetical protein